MSSGITVMAPQTENFSIDYSVRTSWKMDSFHYHNGFEIFLALTSGVNCFVEDRVYSVKRGDLFVFGPMTLHRTVLSQSVQYERYVVSFGADYVYNFSKTCEDLLDPFQNSSTSSIMPLHLSDDEITDLCDLIKKAEGYIKSAIYNQETHKIVALMEILLFINGVLVTANPSVTLYSDFGYERLKPIIEYINTNLAQELSLDDISARFYLCKSYLGKLFKKYTGFTVHEYIITKRIALAQDLLNRGLSVTLVCEKAGFSNYSHFIRTFSKLVKVSPKQFAIKNS